MSEKENISPEEKQVISPQKVEPTFEDFLLRIKPKIHILWEKKWSIFWFNFTVGILSICYLLFLTKPYYTSTVTILPDYGGKSSMLGNLSGLAAIAGVNVGKSEPTEIYEELVRSEIVLSPCIYSKYLTSEYLDSVNLIDYFNLEYDHSKSEEFNKRRMFLDVYDEIFNERMATKIDRLTKILKISITMPEAKLSADIANNIVTSLDEYILKKRKSNVSEERYYIEKRASQVKDSLFLVEEKLEEFSEKNRMVRNSPKLLIEQGRLKRRIEILQSVYIELQKQLEIAKIEEIKETPVINIKERVKFPVKKTGPHRLLIFCLVQIISVVFIILFISSKSWRLLFKKTFRDVTSAE